MGAFQSKRAKCFAGALHRFIPSCWSRAPRPTRSQRPTHASKLSPPQRLVELRDRWLNPEGADDAELKKRTLTNLYNQRPTWLANARAALDAAVFAAYGWPSDLTDEQILERLLALNLERAAGQGGVSAATDADEEAE
jgi:hypothetical protein